MILTPLAPLVSFPLGIVLLLVAACSVPLPRAVVAAPFKGKVVDAETKRPLPGAVVLLWWNLEAPGIAHGPIERFLDAEETLTDDEGEFVIGKWSPQATIPGTWVSDPYFIIHSPGYGWFPMHGVSVKKRSYEPFWKAMQTELVTFELPRLKTREERVREEIYMLLPSTLPHDQMPKLIRSRNVSARELNISPYPTPKE